jgi:hypothetical protein
MRACEDDRTNLLGMVARFFMGKHHPEVRYNFVKFSTFKSRTAAELNLW